MKMLYIAVLCLVILPLSAQGTLQTKSTSIESLITFVAEEFPSKDIKNTTSHHVTLLVETHNKQLNKDTKNVLKQSVLFLTERLSDTDAISIAFYNETNGLLVNTVGAKQTKVILHAIETGTLKQLYKDGLSESFTHANHTISKFNQNTLVFVKTPKQLRQV